jgi:hypothetical protein
VELIHREKRPALERHIIDTSEWTRANDRYVMKGLHFRSQEYTRGLNELAALCKIVQALAHLGKYQPVPSSGRRDLACGIDVSGRIGYPAFARWVFEEKFSFDPRCTFPRR